VGRVGGAQVKNTQLHPEGRQNFRLLPDKTIHLLSSDTLRCLCWFSQDQFRSMTTQSNKDYVFRSFSVMLRHHPHFEGEICSLILRI